MMLALQGIGLLVIVVGAGFFVVGTVGLIRLPDTLSRLHALTKADSLGLGLVALGLLPFAESIGEALLPILAWALVMLSGATAAQLIAEWVER
jgi:multicomponent Na+:H+ antiporter subunit G